MEAVLGPLEYLLVLGTRSLLDEEYLLPDEGGLDEEYLLPDAGGVDLLLDEEYLLPLEGGVDLVLDEEYLLPLDGELPLLLDVLELPPLLVLLEEYLLSAEDRLILPKSIPSITNAANNFLIMNLPWFTECQIIDSFWNHVNCNSPKRYSIIVSPNKETFMSLNKKSRSHSYNCGEKQCDITEQWPTPPAGLDLCGDYHFGQKFAKKVVDKFDKATAAETTLWSLREAYKTLLNSTAQMMRDFATQLADMDAMYADQLQQALNQRDQQLENGYEEAYRAICEVRNAYNELKNRRCPNCGSRSDDCEKAELSGPKKSYGECKLGCSDDTDACEDMCCGEKADYMEVCEKDNVDKYTKVKKSPRRRL